MFERKKANAHSAADFSSVLLGLPRGRHDLTSEQYQTPQAAFAAPEKVARNLAFQTGQIFLGMLGGSVEHQDGKPVLRGGIPIGITDDRHMITIAGTRAGKGRSAIVPNLLLWPHSVLAIDVKGELSSLTAAHRKLRLGQHVHVLDPFGIAKLPDGVTRAAFNPMRAVAGSALIESAALIADSLVVSAGRDPHWDETARNLIEGVVLHVATDPYYTDRVNLGTVRKTLVRAVEGEGLEEEMRNNPEADGLVEIAAADFFDKPPNERNSVLSTARRHLKFLDYPEIRAALEGHDFELSELKTQPATIYLCLPARHMSTCSRWFRLFINLALQEMERTPEMPATGGPVLFCMDEFATLGHMRQIEDAAGQIAGFGVKLWPILQDLGQLKALYGDRWETFMGNAGVMQFFGNNDLTTLKWISERCGKTTVRVRRDSPVAARDRAASGMSGESWSSELHDLLSAEEAGRFFGRDDPQLRQLILRPGKDPIVLQRAFYDQHEFFADREQ